MYKSSLIIDNEDDNLTLLFVPVNEIKNEIHNYIIMMMRLIMMMVFMMKFIIIILKKIKITMTMTTTVMSIRTEMILMNNMKMKKILKLTKIN